MDRFLILVFFIYIIGVLGLFLMRKNLLLLIMSIELMLLSINFNFIVFSIYIDDIVGQIFTLFILIIAAAESSIGLAILVVFYRLTGSILVTSLGKIKG